MPISMTPPFCCLVRSATCFPYSTYSLSCNLAKNVGGWDAEWISEDWHMFLKCFLQSGGVCTVRTQQSLAVARFDPRLVIGSRTPRAPACVPPPLPRGSGAPDFPPDRELHAGGHNVVGHDLGALGAGQEARAGYRRDGVLPEPTAGRVHETGNGAAGKNSSSIVADVPVTAAALL